MEPFTNKNQNLDFKEIIKPGRVIIFDLRDPFINKDEAMILFLVITNQISKIGSFNKLIVFDEAHEYFDKKFDEKLSSRINMMRHEGNSYIFATQTINSLPKNILKRLANIIAFKLSTQDNVKELIATQDKFRINEDDLLGMEKGTAYIYSSNSDNSYFSEPRKVKFRPRSSKHGGESRIY